MLSAWIYAACARHGQTKSPELATLFVRSCRISQLPIIPLFVFDGPGRPSYKRGKLVQGTNHWITQGMKEMLDAFGFAWIMVSS